MYHKVQFSGRSYLKFLCDLFLFINDIEYSYAIDKNPEKIIKVFKHTSVDLLTSFKKQWNESKCGCHLLVDSKQKVCAKIGPYDIQSSELLWLLIDKLTLDKHINNLCAKASQKLNQLCRLSSFMCTNKKRLVTKAFISSEFSYCPLIWMNHSRMLNNKINRIPQWAFTG